MTQQKSPAKKNDDSAVDAIVAIVVAGLIVMAFWGWSSGLWERNSSSSPPRQLSPAEVDRLYRSQFESEEERIEFEAWYEGQRSLEQDMPVGQTRGGDPY